MRDEARLVGKYVESQIRRLKESQDANIRATLARLRKGIGKAPGSLPDLWEVTLSNLPDKLQSLDGKPTYGEWAVHTALTLFALHQQGKDLSTKCMSQDSVPLGRAVRMLAKDEEDLPRIKRRFDAAATSDNLAEFAHHLRGLVQLLKATDIPLDYPELAKDLYFFQFDGAVDNVRLKWGQDFYRRLKDDDGNTTDEDNTGGK